MRNNPNTIYLPELLGCRTAASIVPDKDDKLFNESKTIQTLNLCIKPCVHMILVNSILPFPHMLVQDITKMHTRPGFKNTPVEA